MRIVPAIVMGCAVGALSLWVSEARAGQVIVTPGAQNFAAGGLLGEPFANANLGPNGTTYLKAVSQQQGLKPNGTTTTSLTSGGVVRANPTARLGTGIGIRVPIAPKMFNVVGPPLVFLPNQGKSLIKQNGDFESITSNTGGYTGGSLQAQFNNQRSIAAFGLTANPNIAGGAAGQAYDPIMVTPGTALTYAPQIEVDIESSLKNEIGGVEFYALDQNTFSDVAGENSDFPGPIDDFNDNNNADTLWTLDITENGLAAFSVDFELNSASELSFSSAELTDLNCTGANDNNTCIDSALDAEIKGDLTSDSLGGQEIADLPLFQDSVTYTPTGDPNTPIEFGEGVDAGMEVPEPSSIALFLVGLMALGFLSRRRPCLRVIRRQ